MMTTCLASQNACAVGQQFDHEVQVRLRLNPSLSALRERKGILDVTYAVSQAGLGTIHPALGIMQ